MNRRQFLFTSSVTLGGIALVGTGCGASYAILQQASPNPFVGATKFAIEPISFENLQVGRGSEADYLGRKNPQQIESYQADKQKMIDEFVSGVTDRSEGIEVVAGSAPAPDFFVVHPHITYIEPGYYVGVSRMDTEVRMDCKITRANGEALDAIRMYATVQASLYNPSTGGRLGSAAKRCAKTIAKYLKNRTAAK